MVTPHTAFTNELLCHFRTLSNKLYTWFDRALKLEVGGKIVVIRENLNSRILQNRPFANIFHHEYFPAYGLFPTKCMGLTMPLLLVLSL